MSGITCLVGGTGAGAGGATGVGVAFSCDSKDATDPPNPVNVGATGSGCMSGIRVTMHGVFSDADAATSLHASEALSCSRRDLTASGSWRPLGSAYGVLRGVRVTLIFIPVLVRINVVLWVEGDANTNFWRLPKKLATYIQVRIWFEYVHERLSNTKRSR